MSPRDARVWLESEFVTQFSDLGVSTPILKALASEGYDTPTPIQSQAIPIVLKGRDLNDLPYIGDNAVAMLDELLWWTNALMVARATA